MTAEAEAVGQILEVPVDILKTGLAAAKLEDNGLGLSTAASLEALRSWRKGHPLMGMVRVEIAEGMPTVITPERTLTLAAGNYRGNRESPEALCDLLDAYWKNFWANLVASGRSLSPSNLQLSFCPFTGEDLYNLRQQPVPDMGFFLPRVLADKDGLPILRAGLPEMSIHVQNEGQINYTPRDNWMSPESVLYTPHSGTTQKEAEKILLDNNRYPMTPNVFIAFSGLMRRVEGRFIDEQSVSRLLGYLSQGRAASADCLKDGYCLVYCYWHPKDRPQLLGARSLGVKS